MQILESCDQKTTIHNIYVYPTKVGWIYIVAVLVMWLFGVNYDNNLVLLTALFGGSCFLVSIFLTWSNLRDISIFPYVSSHEVRANEGVPMYFSVQSSDKVVYGVRIASNLSQAMAPMDVAHGSKISLLCQDLGRGIFRLPRFKIYSDFPLGLIRAAFYVEANEVVTIFPRVIPCEFLPQKDFRNFNGRRKEHATQTNSLNARADAELSGLRKYQAGDSLNLIAWKQLAKGRGLMVREFSADTSSCVKLNETSVRARHYEEQISMLAHAVNALSARGVMFGLEFAGINVLPNKGERHRLSLQKALALLPKFEDVDALSLNNEKTNFTSTKLHLGREFKGGKL